MRVVVAEVVLVGLWWQLGLGFVVFDGRELGALIPC